MKFMSGWYVSSNDIVAWTNTLKRTAESELPVLVRSLIEASVTPAELSFPGGNDVVLQGLDGFLKVENSATRFVPSGCSVWEFGTNLVPKKKADDDYNKRTQQDIPGLIKKETTFIFVTSRKWSTKQKWVTERNNEKQWANVMVIDAIELATWLEKCPGVHRWFARQVGKLGSTDSSWDWDYAWHSWSKATTPNFSIDLAVGGREKQVAEIISKIQGLPAVIRVNAVSIEDSYGFILAALAKAPGILSRIVVVRREEGWNALLSERKTGPLILINCCSKDLNHGLAISLGHHVIVFKSDYSIGADQVKLPVPNKRNQIDALVLMGLDKEKAERIVRSSHGRTTLIRRHPEMSPKELNPPEWVTPNYANVIIPVMLAEVWSSSNQDDRRILATLSNMDYEALEEKLVELSLIDDPPVRLVGDNWTILSRQDAFMYLRRFVSVSFVRRLCSVADEILQENDPRFEVSPQERWMCLGRSKYSNGLSRGVSSALTMIVHEFSEDNIVSFSSIRDCVGEHIIKILGSSIDASRWYSLREYLPLLAEANPIIFLTSLEVDLKKEKPEISALFVEEGIMGSFPHASLLWALETISWNEKYFERVISVLVSLCRIELDSHCGNRPFSSLQRIFKPWLPYSVVPYSERMQILDRIYKKEPSIVWNLLLDMLPQNHDVCSPIHRPEYADWGKDWSENVSNSDVQKTIKLVQKSVLEKVDEIPGEHWPQLLNCIQVFDSNFMNELIVRLEQCEWEKVNKDKICELNTVLHKIISRHKQFSESKWAFPSEFIERLERFQVRLAEFDILAKYSYLFDWGTLPLELNGGEYKKQEKLAIQKRVAALEEVWQAKSEEAITVLAEKCEAITIFADSLVYCSFSEVIEPKIFSWILGDNLKLRQVSSEYIFRCGRIKANWIEETLKNYKNKWDEHEHAQFLANLPFNLAIVYVEKLTGAAQERYWQIMEPNGVIFDDVGQVTKIVSNLLLHSRANIAAHVVKLSLFSNDQSKIISDELMSDILEKIVMDESVDYDAVESIIKFLQEHKRIAEGKLAMLEWKYIPLLRARGISPSSLINNLLENPALFVYMLRLMYKPNVETEEQEPEFDLPNREALVSRAHDLLESLNKLPGLSANIIDQESLLRWINAVREESKLAHRDEIADINIGKLLARSPVGSDGIWPHEVIRDVLEYYQNDTIENGFIVERFNQRGVTTRGLFDGGTQELQLAEAYAEDAHKVKIHWPRMAKILMSLSENYLWEAKRCDVNAELTELRIY